MNVTKYKYFKNIMFKFVSLIFFSVWKFGPDIGILAVLMLFFYTPAFRAKLVKTPGIYRF